MKLSRPGQPAYLEAGFLACSRRCLVQLRLSPPRGTSVLGCLRLLALASTLLTAVSCSDLFGGVCTEEARAAIVLEIRNAVTAAPLADSSTALVTDGSFSDTLQLCGQTSSLEWLSRCGPFERPGTYNVVVARPGYQSWSRAGVRVTHDDCHVQTVTLQVRLEPDK
jgi:hypothetical protein